MTFTRSAFDEELKKLQEDLLRMAAAVEEMLHASIEALTKRDVNLAEEALQKDDVVDEYNLSIENKCLELIALQQPAARDLRIIASAMKIITDVERCGDYAVDIAKTVMALSQEPVFKPLVDIPQMADIVKKMLREAIEGFVEKDLEKIQRMIEDDDRVDHFYNELHEELALLVEKEGKLARQAFHFLLLGRYLERIADHITNIGERVYYVETGELKELHQ